MWRSRIICDVPVGTITTNGTERTLGLDLYLPDPGTLEPPEVPLLVYIHGGGWREGTKDRPPGYRTVLSRGVVLASLEYRFSYEGRGFEMLADLRRGAQVAMEAVEAEGFRVRDWVLWGFSAGAHLASLLAHRMEDSMILRTSPASDDPRSVRRPSGVVAWSGVYDFARYASLEGIPREQAPRVAEFERGLSQGDPEERVWLSPIALVGADSVPHLLIHGDQDEQVAVEQSRLMHAALREAGVASTLMVLPGAPHSMPVGDSPRLHATIDFASGARPIAT